MSKFNFLIFSDRAYQVTVDDWDGKPYTFEVSGQEIEDALRRDALLDKAWKEAEEMRRGDVSD